MAGALPPRQPPSPLGSRPRPSAAALPPRQVRAKLRRAFISFDTDGSGSISLAELEAAFRQCGIFVPDAALKRMFREADVDRSGAIELAEFEALARRQGLQPCNLAPAAAACAPEPAAPRCNPNSTRGRLLAPTKPGGPAQPRPGDGSATAKVFAALENGKARLAASELPHALKLLGIDAEEPAVAKLVARAAEVTGGHAVEAATPRTPRCNPAHPTLQPCVSQAGALDESEFRALVHEALVGKEARPPGPDQAKPAPSAAPGDAAVPPGSAAAAAAEARHVHARLAHAFALADSLDGGTVAAHEVGALLWRTGVVTAAAQLAALRPPPSDSAKRVGFEQALRA